MPGEQRERDVRIAEALAGRLRKRDRAKVPYYSTRYEGLAVVLDAMLAKGWHFHTFSSMGASKDEWWATFSRHGDGDFHGKGDTLPAAVAAAAEAALTGKPE